MKVPMPGTIPCTMPHPRAVPAESGNRAPPAVPAALLALLLAACGGSGALRAPVQEVPVEGQQPASAAPASPSEPAPGAAVVRPLPQEPLAAKPLQAPQSPAAEPVNPAVVALLDAAGRQERAGRTDRAAASLERALQIEPRNAWLWHRLAALRLRQGQLDQAASLASKSNALDPDNHTLVADNWRLIARARRQQGDAAAAREAEQRAARVAGGSH